MMLYGKRASIEHVNVWLDSSASISMIEWSPILRFGISEKRDDGHEGLRFGCRSLLPL